MISMKDGVPCVSTRLSTAFFQGYTFTKRPLQIGEQYLVQITKTSQLYVGSLSFGVTCCDPNSIAIGELPDDPNQLVDRREYWVMSRNVAEDTKPGDLLVFSINHNGNFIPSRFCSFGRMEYHRTVVFIQTFVPCCVLISVFFFCFPGEVLCSKNGNPDLVLMCVDHSQTLWGVFDIYGTTTQIVVSKILVDVPSVGGGGSSGGCSPNTIVQSSVRPSTSYETISSAPQTVCYNNTPQTPPPPMVRSNILEVNTDANGGTVLIVNLPAATQTNQICHPSPAMSQASGCVQQQQLSVRPPSVTIQQIQPRVAPVQQSHVPEVRDARARLINIISSSTIS